MMMDGLAGGIIPSWEGVLKLATRAKFHLGTTHLMEMVIVLNSSFWEEDQNWYKDHLIWTSRSVFLNFCPHMGKLFRSTTSPCRLMKPNGHDSSPSTTCILQVTSHLTWHHHHSHSSLSFPHWFVQLLDNFSLSLSHVARKTSFYTKL